MTLKGCTITSAKAVFALVGTLLLTSCGGGGGSPDLVTPSIGYFLDSAVGGITYQTATQSGITGSDGSFKYVEGEQVTFSVGKIKFAPVLAAGEITPLDIAGTTDPKDNRVVNMLVFLQSIDEDANPANGIAVPSDAAKNATSELDFSLAPTSFGALDAFTSLVSALPTASLSNEDQALAHFLETVRNREIQISPIAHAGENQTVSAGTTVTLDGTDSVDANGDEISYAWEVVSKPEGSAAVLSSTTGTLPTFYADVAGSYVFTLKVNDGVSSSSSDTVIVNALAPDGGSSTSISGVSSGGVGSLALGTISGFGSIIVNGVRYDDANAQVGDVDGDDHTGLGALKLGMLVAVQGSATTTANAGFNYTAEGTANQVVFLTELKGPVSAVDAANLTFDVLGQRVRWSSTTIFDGLASSATNLAAGQEAEVYGLWNASAQEWQATRVETSVTTPAFYRLTGEVSAIDAASQTLTISGQAVSYTGLTLDSNMAVGSRVRTVLNPTPVAGAWVASAVRLADWSAVPLVTWSPTEAEGHEAELEGIVTGLVGTRFELQGFVVDGSALKTTLSNGQRVEIKGRFVNGVLVASSFKADGDSERASRGFELHGVVSSTTSSTFVLRDFMITYDSNSQGTAGLADGAYVEAHIALQADGTWRAVEMEVKSTTSSGSVTETSSSNDHYGSDGETEDENDGD